MPWIDNEKPALVATFRVTDPDQPTLCTGWTARHLLAHLVQREQDPLASIGDLIIRRPPGSEKYLGRRVEAALTPEGFDALLERFVQGPPRWSPMSWASESMNFVEYVIHHEDLRRGGDHPADPRVLPDKEQRAIWKRLRTFGRLVYRRAPTGVTLATPAGDREPVRTADAEVTVLGEPVELLLYLSGRRQAARVEITGGPDAMAAFDGWVSSTRGGPS